LTKLCKEYGCGLARLLVESKAAMAFLTFSRNSRLESEDAPQPKKFQEKLSLVPHDLQRTALEHLQFVAVSIPPDSSKRGWCHFSPRVMP